MDLYAFRKMIRNGDFETVDYVPLGYSIWNIGDIGDGYIPLCTCQDDECPAYVSDILLIKAEKSRKIMEAARYGLAHPHVYYQLNELYSSEKEYSIITEGHSEMMKLWWEVTRSEYFSKMNIIPPFEIRREEIPKGFHGVFLLGEPYSFDRKGMTYLAYGIKDERYFYIGLRHAENEEPVF